MAYEVAIPFINQNDLSQEYDAKDVFPKGDYKPEEAHTEELLNLGYIIKKTTPSEMTVDKIKEKLDSDGIEYDSKANKKELVELLGKE